MNCIQSYFSVSVFVSQLCWPNLKPLLLSRLVQIIANLVMLNMIVHWENLFECEPSEKVLSCISVMEHILGVTVTS